ncbi:Cytochrome b-c1 complex subunit 8, mitochondrial [Rhodosporidiobolus nylandii]
MRASSAVHSGMRGPKQKGINSYVVSPFRQAPMRGAFKHWIVRGYKRIGQQAVYFAPPLAAGYFILSWAIQNNHLRNSKVGQAQGLYP